MSLLAIACIWEKGDLGSRTWRASASTAMSGGVARRDPKASQPSRAQQLAPMLCRPTLSAHAATSLTDRNLVTCAMLAVEEVKPERR
jgi:hypothetical protein